MLRGEAVVILGDGNLLVEHPFMLIGRNSKALYIQEKTQEDKHAYLKQVAAGMRNRLNARVTGRLPSPAGSHP